MSLLVLVPVLILGGLHWYFHARLVRAPRWGSRALRWGIDLALLLLLALVLTSFGTWLDRFSPAQVRPFAWLGSVWMAMWVYLLLALTLASLVSAVMRIRSGSAASAAARVRWNRRAAPASVLVALAVTAYGVVRAADPVLTPTTVRSAQLPADFDGARVALVTDLHAGAIRSAAFTRTVVDRVNAARPDIVILSGDLIDGAEPRFAPEIEPLRRLRAPGGVYAVTGNHETYAGDTGAWVARWRALGITVLTNQWTRLSRGESHITIAGINDWSGQPPYAPDPARALDGVPRDDFVLLLAHQPRQARTVQGRGVDLQLSGHTHGGQLWPGRFLVPLQQPAVDGVTEVGDVLVLTSRGAGAWGPPVRVGADPQIPLITLRRG